MALAREMMATSVAFPALGTGIGGYPLEEAAAITVATVRDELARNGVIEHVVFALRGAATYEAFRLALLEEEAAEGAHPPVEVALK
jgi:O-acetyl-ADP-ribose deacetylase (regulator of RNase III)